MNGGSACRPRLVRGNGGVALLISSGVAMVTKPLEVVEWIKGRVMSCKLRLHHEWPLITVAVCYGSNIKEERNEIESVLSQLSEQPLLVGGDFNGITNVRESTCRSINVLYWELLRDI